ncbi:MAG: Hsp20/alpha crystallin family protein [Candidatus Omnitrophica bacterium]|nr:Hsp20/alpha crystallin family protein [Candidatus Omnitrophota bacterium]
MSLLPRKQHNVVLRNPFWEFEKFHRDMSRIFDQGISGDTDQDVSLWAGAWSPAVDVMDQKDAILVKADLPGLTKDDIDVVIENNVLSIRGEKKHREEQKEGDVIRSERYYGSFHRAFTLPSTVDAQKVQAKFQDGVLELQIAKKEEAKPKQIKVDVK